MSELAESVATETAPNADAEGAQVSGAESAPAGEIVATPVTPEEKAKNQERINQLTRERYQALSRAEQLERENREAKAELERLRSTAKPQQIAPAKFPTLEEHGYDEAKYAEAVQAYIRGQSTQVDPKEAVREVLEQEKQQQQAQTREQSWRERESKFAKSKPDFAEKVYRLPSEGGPVITDSMLEVIVESDLGPQVAYHLAENPEVSAAIARMSPVNQARELGRIEARLEAQKAPPPPPVSQAPPPVKTITTESPKAPETDPSKMTDKQFAEWRRRQIAQRR